MGVKTKISYADSTINPTPCCIGCELYSRDPAKNHCYAASIVRRYAGLKGWPEDFNSPTHFPDRLGKAIRWSDLTSTQRPAKPWLDGVPRIVFVNDMGDGFSGMVDPEEWLLPHLSAMSESPHVWLFLSKWPQRMADFFSLHPAPNNFWLGTTVTSDATSWRMSELTMIQGNLLLSLEPLLGSLSIAEYLRGRHYVDGTSDPIPGTIGEVPYHATRLSNYIQWVVLGGESGSNARPLHPNWARAVQRACADADIPFMLKQWGTWKPHRYGGQFDTRTMYMDELGRRGADMWDENGQSRNHICTFEFCAGMQSGRLLDGKEYTGMPTLMTSTGYQESGL